MKLSNKDFALFLELQKKMKAGKISDADAKKLAELTAMKEAGNDSSNSGTKAGKQDPAWYMKYPALAKAASNVVFNYIAGTKFEYDSKQTASSPYLPVGYKINYIPTPGKCEDATSAFNYQMRNLWLQMHRKYRGIGTYEYSDLGIAMFSIFAFFADIARAERIYGVLHKYDIYNRSVPERLTAALGVGPNPSAADLADFKFQIDNLIERSARLCLPKGFSALNAMFSIAGEVFKDSDDPRAAWFFYDNPYRITYKPTKFNTGGCAAYEYRTTTQGTQTFANIIADLEAQYQALYNDDDIARMCSDLIACFGEAGLVTLVPIPNDYTVVPTKSDARLLQLHNSTLAGEIHGTNMSPSIFGQSGNAPIDLYQENGCMRFEIACCPGGYSMTGYQQGTANYRYGRAGSYDDIYTGDSVLDTWENEVSVESIVEMTRQQFVMSKILYGSGSNPTVTVYEIDSFGFVVPLTLTCYPAVSGATIIGQQNYVAYPATTTAAIATFVNAALNLSKLDWAPIMHVLSPVANGSGSYSEYGVLNDLDHYTLIQRLALKRIHEVSTLSGFKVDDAQFAVLDQGEKDSRRFKR